MIKQDYLIRMIQEILALLVNVILNKKKLRQQEWSEFDNLTQRILDMPTEELLNTDAETLINHYQGDDNYFEKLELAAMYQLKLADELKDDSLVFRSKLLHEALYILKYIQKEGNTFSLTRGELIQKLEKDIL